MRYRTTDKTVPEDPFEWFLLVFILVLSPAIEAVVEPILGEPFSEKWKE